MPNTFQTILFTLFLKKINKNRKKIKKFTPKCGVKIKNALVYSTTGKNRAVAKDYRFVGTLMQLNALIIFILLILANPSLAQNDQASTLYDFNVNSQVIEEALSELANQAGCQLLFSYEVVESQQSKQVVGRYTINTALSILLADTHLSGRLT